MKYYILTLSALVLFAGKVFAAEKPAEAATPKLAPGSAEKILPKKGEVPEGNAFPGEKTDFKGFDLYKVKTAKGYVSVVCPKKSAPGKPWLWRSMFWKAVPNFHKTDLTLVEQGYHVVIAPGHVYGHPKGNAGIDAAYELLTTEYGFAQKCSMASMSRETNALFRWATTHPERVESIYVDNGVLNLRSWPGGAQVPGSNSKFKGHLPSWEGLKKAYGFTSDEDALAAKISPIDLLEPLAKAGVPILTVCGSKDDCCIYEEHDAILEERYNALGGDITVIVENKGHSHGMKDPTPVLDFIKKHTAAMAIEHYENSSLAQRKTAKKKPTKKSANEELVDVSEGRPVVRLWPLDQVGGPANRLKHDVTRRGKVRYENVKDPHLVVFSAQRAEPNPAVVYCPGGSYQHQTPKPEIIEWLNECGVTVFMLKYRASGDREAAFKDVQRAMRLVRQNAKKWNIDPNQLGVVGSSAGGHLVLRLSQCYNQRAYPEIDDADQQSCEPNFVITGSAAYLCEKGTQKIVEEFPMSGKIAPTFMVCALDDKSHGGGSVVYEKALNAAGGTTGIMVSETGGHGLKDVNWFSPCEEWLQAQGIKISPVK